MSELAWVFWCSLWPLLIIAKVAEGSTLYASLELRYALPKDQGKLYKMMLPQSLLEHDTPVSKHDVSVNIHFNCLFSFSLFFHGISPPLGEHQMELLDYVAAKFHEEAGIFKLLVYI